MKRTILLLLIFPVLFTEAQQQYVTEKGLHYYPDPINSKDAYISSQCFLDLYYPENAKNFATIGVNYRLSPQVTAPAYIEDAAARFDQTPSND